MHLYWYFSGNECTNPLDTALEARDGTAAVPIVGDYAIGSGIQRYLTEALEERWRHHELCCAEGHVGASFFSELNTGAHTLAISPFRLVLDVLPEQEIVDRIGTSAND